MTTESGEDPRRSLPAVDALLSHPRVAESARGLSHDVAVFVARAAIENERDRIASSPSKAPISHDDIAARVARHLAELMSGGPRRVINATGVVLHTGLGRAPLSRDAATALQQTVGYCNLEINLESGERGERQDHVEALLCALSGAEAALVVNNNAAALYLVLCVLGYRREVIVSRGQLIEIGGSFRLPDIMRRSGARLVEVGTTNRTRIGDYREAVSEKTALLLRAHPSNFRIVGFTESVPLEDLVELGRERGIPVADDIGNGLLWDWSALGLPAEVNARGSLAAGADLVLMSGDKVLGGPQAGIVLGRKDVVSRLKRDPLVRVLRPDKLTIAALAGTLRGHLERDRVAERIPVWKMLSDTREQLMVRAHSLCDRLRPLTGWKEISARECESEAGSGTLPAVALPSAAVCAVPHHFTAARWARKLRTARTPVVAVVKNDSVWFDLRTVASQDEDDLVDAIAATVKGE